MRLLSFHQLVETTLAMLRPEAASGWRRRVDYSTGEALAWHAELGLSLSLRCCAVGADRHSLLARWIGPTGEALFERTYFCGASSFDWQTAAESVAEAMPDAALTTTHNPAGDANTLRAAHA